MVALPTANPVTRPVADTVATRGALVDQVTVRPVSGWPVASLGVAVSCTVPPEARIAVAGATSTHATVACPAVTVSCAVPVLPSLAAVMVALPTPTPVTRPPLDTVATAALLLLQTTVRPLNGSPPPFLRSAASWTVAPTATLADAGVTSTDATGSGGTPARISSPMAAPFALGQVALMVLSPTDHSVSRSDGGVSPEGCSAVSRN